MTDLSLITASIETEKLLSGMTDEQRDKVLAMSNSIDIRDEKSITTLGSNVSKNINSLNTTVLQTIKIRDIPEIESILPQLNSAFKEVDSTSLITKKQGFMSKFFHGDQVKNFVQKFENAEHVVSDIQNNLEKVQHELRKDIELEDSLGRQNLKLIAELDDTILAMRIKLNEAVSEFAEKQAEVDPQDFVTLQLLEDEKDQIDSLDKQIYWLEQQKMLAIQTLPILRNLKVSNKDMIRQIELAVQQSIPAWKQGIIIAFHIHRQQGALRIERAVHDMTNQMVKQNAQMLKESSAEIMKAVQSGMIDMDTFREANKTLIETSKQITEIKNQSMKNRQNNIEEYRKLTEQLIEAEKRDIQQLVTGDKTLKIGGNYET